MLRTVSLPPVSLAKAASVLLTDPVAWLATISDLDMDILYGADGDKVGLGDALRDAHVTSSGIVGTICCNGWVGWIYPAISYKTSY